jgi:uncharacterized damage-inducible protein DinB
MTGPWMQALISHLDSIFVGPNGDYPSVLEALEGVSAAQAAWKPGPKANAIWQIVEHLIGSKRWQIEVLEKGQAASPPWTGEHAVDESAWQATLARLNTAHSDLKAALGKVQDQDLLAVPPGEKQTMLELLLSSAFAHEAYHGGQIDYLKGLQAQ